MSWPEDVAGKEQARQKLAREAVSAIHTAVADELEGADEQDILLTYLAVVKELLRSVMISMRADQSSRMLLKKMKDDETPTPGA